MNKEQLTLEQKAIYFPYGVRGIKEDTGEIYELTSLTLKNETWTPILFGDATNKPCKLALRPLSQLTEEIEHNGKKFVPINYWDNEIKAIKYHEELSIMSEHNYCDGYLPYKIQQKLIEWKFDVFGLIEKNLAIDVTTLETNPYK